jgi:hypothetical protein
MYVTTFLLLLLFPGIGIRFPVWERDFSVLFSAQNGSGANTAMGAGENFTRNKAVG